MTTHLDEPRSTPSAAAGPPRQGLSPLARTAMPLALYVAGLALLVRVASLPLWNPDTFLHLRLGRELLSGTWSVAHPGSPTSTGTADWVPTQWLAQVVMAGAEQVGGLPAAAWFGGLQLVLLVAALLAAARRYTELLLAVPVVAVAVLASMSGLSARPQVMSYVLAVATTVLWLRTWETRRVPWLLVPLTWFWTTWHGMWPVSVVLGVVACAGLAADRRVSGRHLASMCAVPVLSLVAALLTPVGPRVVSGVLTVTGRGEYFTEWGPTSFSDVNGIAFLLLAGACLVAATRRRPSTTVLLLLLVAGGAAAYSERTLPVAAAIITPITAMLLQQTRGVAARRPGRGERLTVGLAPLTALVALALLVPHTAERPERDLTALTTVLDDEPAGTPVLADMGLGGLLLWAEPQLDVRVHGYADVFTDAELEDVVTMRDGLPGWQEVARRSGARLAVVNRDSFLGYDLRVVGWTPVARAEDAELLVAPPGW